MSKQCFEQAHMTCAEFGLWTQYRILSYKSGILFCDGRKTAERFSGENKDHIYRLRKKLVANGWLVVVKDSKYDKKTGRRTKYEFHVLSHEQWVKKHGKKDCKSEVFEGLLPFAPVQMVEKSLSQIQEQPSCTSKNGPVAPARHSSKQTPVINKNSPKLPPVSQEESEYHKPDGPQTSREGETVQPFAPVQMVDPFPRLNYERHAHPQRPWSVPRSGATAAESAEAFRRNDERLRPEDVLVDVTT